MVINLKFLQKNSFLKQISYKLAKRRAQRVVTHIKQYLRSSDRILDIGAGTCTKCEILHEENHEVTPIDIKNLSLVDSIKPIIYNGQKLPFKKNQFNVTLLLFILHHTPRPKKILAEATRVSKRIIIIEDIHTNIIHKYLTYFFDSFINQEFRGHPHSNKTDKQWKVLFNQLGLKLKDAKYKRHYLILKHAIYSLEK